MPMLSLSSTTICRDSLFVLLPFSIRGWGSLCGAETAAIVAPTAIAMIIPATIASLAPLVTIFYDIRLYLKMTIVIRAVSVLIFRIRK